MENSINKIKSLILPHSKPKNFKIFEYTKIINPEYVYAGDNIIIDDFCLLYAKKDCPIYIGSFVHIASFSSLTGGPIKIGNYCTIASGCRIIAGSDHYLNGALMNSTVADEYRHLNRSGCVLEDFSFLGANTIIFPGVIIGEGAVVGAGASVRTDLEPWGIYVMKKGKLKKVNTRDQKKTYETAKKQSIDSKDRIIEF